MSLKINKFSVFSLTKIGYIIVQLIKILLTGNPVKYINSAFFAGDILIYTFGRRYCSDEGLTKKNLSLFRCFCHCLLGQEQLVIIPVTKLTYNFITYY